MSETHEATLVRSLLRDVVAGGELDRINELLAEDFVNHTSVESGADQAVQGRESFRAEVQRLREGFPDLDLRVEHLISEGGYVAAHFRVTGTHRGPFGGYEATGRFVDVPAVTLFRIAHGRVADRWNVTDRLTMMRQMGVFPDERRGTG